MDASLPFLDAQITERILACLEPGELVTASQVCRLWCSMSRRSRQIWSQHLDNSMDVLAAGLRPAPSALQDPEHPLKGTSFLRLYLATIGRNFLRNPTFSAFANKTASLMPSRRPWVVQEGSHSGLFEHPPQGVMRPLGDHPVLSYPPVPIPYPDHSSSIKRALQRLTEPVGPGCLATADDWSEVLQVVDMEAELIARGLSLPEAHAVLDAGLILGLSIHVASHYAHPGIFAVGLMLDNGQGAVDTQSFVARSSSCHYWSGRIFLPASSGWRRFSHAVTCPKGFRRAIVLLHGRRRSSISSDAPGPKGVRFASPELRFVPRQHLEAFDVTSDNEYWVRAPGSAATSTGGSPPRAAAALAGHAATAAAVQVA